MNIVQPLLVLMAVVVIQYFDLFDSDDSVSMFSGDYSLSYDDSNFHQQVLDVVVEDYHLNHSKLMIVEVFDYHLIMVIVIAVVVVDIVDDEDGHNHLFHIDHQDMVEMDCHYYYYYYSDIVPVQDKRLQVLSNYFHYFQVK